EWAQLRDWKRHHYEAWGVQGDNPTGTWEGRNPASGIVAFTLVRCELETGAEVAIEVSIWQQRAWQLGCLPLKAELAWHPDWGEAHGIDIPPTYSPPSRTPTQHLLPAMRSLQWLRTLTALRRGGGGRRKHSATGIGTEDWRPKALEIRRRCRQGTSIRAAAAMIGIPE